MGSSVLFKIAIVDSDYSNVIEENMTKEDNNEEPTTSAGVIKHVYDNTRGKC